MPGGGMTIRLPQLVGLDRRRMSLTGDYIDAETARDWGLVVEVVAHESLLARAQEVAVTIASIPGEYLSELRRGYDRIGTLSGQEAFEEASWSRAWMAERFDQSRLFSEREKIVAHGGSRRRDSTAHQREGLRGHGPASQPARGGRGRTAGGTPRLRRAPRGRDGARLHGRRTPGRRAHRTDRHPHQRRPGLRPQPDAARLCGMGHREAQRRAVRARPRHADPPEHRGPLRGSLRRRSVGRLGDYVGAVRAAFSSFASGAAPHYRARTTA